MPNENEVTPSLSIEGREEFEKWANGYDEDCSLACLPDGSYSWAETHGWWMAWQASRASDRERVKELERKIEELEQRHVELQDTFAGILSSHRDDWCLLDVIEDAKAAKSAESRVAVLQRELESAHRKILNMEEDGANEHQALAAANRRLSELTGLLKRICDDADHAELDRERLSPELIAEARSHLESSQ